MARPQKKGVDYFPHDSDMSSDTKIEMLELKFGLTGYAVYNKLLELTYKTGGGINFNKEEILEFYSLKWKVNNLKELLCYMIKIKLFSDFKLNSPAINKRIEKIDAERNRKRGLYSQKKEVSAELSEVSTRQNSEKLRNNSQTKLNKTKLKESINIPFTDFWESYDKKRGHKNKLEKKWEALTDEDREKIMKYIPNYKRSEPDKKFRKDPQTFLNNRSWLDELIFDDDKFRNTETKEKEKPDFEKMANELVVKNLSELKNRLQQYDEYSPLDEANYLIKTYKPNIITACPTFDFILERYIKHYVAPG